MEIHAYTYNKLLQSILVLKKCLQFWNILSKDRIMERIVKLLELVSNPFVFIYTIKYVQFNSIQFNVQRF